VVLLLVEFLAAPPAADPPEAELTTPDGSAA
jgi:hypothetical protein